MLTVVVLTVTLFFSNGIVGVRSFVAPNTTLEDCEASKSEIINGITGQEVTGADGTKAKVLYIDGFCRTVTQGTNA